MSDPEKLRPGKTRQALTEEAAGEFAKLALRLRQRGHAPELVAHFVNRLVFCMFAEDIGLLPGAMFSRMLEHALRQPDQFEAMAAQLFGAMRAGGMVGFEKVEWFNGSLFDDDTALPLDKDDIAITLRAAKLGWDEIDPSIFGTLFERGLDPDKRSQLGAHYTDRDKIMLIVEPVIVRPWLAEWKEARAEIEAALTKAEAARSPAARTRAKANAERAYRAFLDRLRRFTVLDPACGSGNFLYLGLHALKDLEHLVMVEAEAMGFAREFPQVGPANVKGIEINPYAAELARVTVWIGEIQWMRRNGFDAARNPILKPLGNIECRDALLNADGSESAWPEAGAIIGNPPFLGDKAMLRTLGDDYVTRLRVVFSDRLPGGVDFVTYWFEKAGAAIEAGATARAGLVATQSIRRGMNRRVLERIRAGTVIFNAWSDEPWVVEGAAVRVSLVCFGRSNPLEHFLDGAPVGEIYADLSGKDLDLTTASPLRQNLSVCYQGTTKAGAFDISGQQARAWLQLPSNPNGRPNSDVLRPWRNGQDVVSRPSDRWIIDFGVSIHEQEAALYEAPFNYIERLVKPERMKVRRETYRRFWWRHAEPRPGLRRAVEGLGRFIATPRVAKHRLFVWMSAAVLPDTRLVVICRDDDTTFGILHSRFHEAWSLRLGGWHGVGNDPQYTPTLGFGTYAFPERLTPESPADDYADDPRAIRIASAAARLNELRENWLNPPDLVKRVPEVVPGYPDRLIPIDDKAATILKERTLTKLYNERPTWLPNAHAELDAAVAAAYGWPEDIPEDEALARLFELNQERARGEAPGGSSATQQPAAEEEQVTPAG